MHLASFFGQKIPTFSHTTRNISSQNAKLPLPTGVGKLALKLFCPLYLQSGVRSPECGESLAIAAVEPFLPMNSTHNKSHPYSQHGLVAILRDKCTYKLCQCAFTSMVTCTIGEPQRIQQLGQKRDVCQ